MKKELLKRKTKILNTVLCIGLCLYTLILLILFVWALMTSLKDDFEFGLNTYRLPESWQFSNYITALKSFSISIPAKIGQRSYVVYMPEMYLNSLLYCVGCAFLSTFIPCLTAYCCSRFPNWFSKAISIIVIFVIIIPVVGSEPSAIRITRFLKIYDTIWGMWLMSASFVGMYFLVFEAMFKSLPRDFSEAAEIDGASEFVIFFRITLPLVRNTFTTVLLILFIQRWNDYSAPLLYLPSHPTVANGVFQFHTSLEAAKASIPMKTTGAMLVFLPMLLLFAVFNGRLMGNLTMGGIKE